MPNFLQVDTLIDEQDGNLSAGDLSLREALDAIDSGGFIAFAPGLTGTILLDAALGSLLVRKNMTIVGTGAKQLAVSGNNATRVFTVDDGNDDNFLTVSFEGLTIQNGKTGNGSGLEISGGGILTLERLTLSNSMVLNNESANGGGIYNSGSLDLFNSTIANNSAGTGGGLMNGPSTTGRIGAANLFNSTVSSNRAAGIGGIVNVVGGSFQGSLRLNNSTVTNNQGTLSTGGIFSQNAVLTDNSIIAGNRSDQATPDVIGSFVSQGYNLVGQVGSATGFGATGDQVGTATAPIDPRLGPLQDNGGLTLTHALLPGSPAIDAGRPGTVGGSSFDQRGAGFARIADGNGDGTSVIDIGAFEVQSPPPFNVINGTNSKDFLQGTSGRDEINGLGGADILIGKASSDSLNGGDGVDTLIGADPQTNQPGLGEIDRLNGGNNADLFVLGDNRRAYYDDGNAATAGAADYGLIADFSRGDLIVLRGRPSNYRLDETRSLGGQSGTAILLKNGSLPANDEVIGFVANATGLNLERRALQFLYV